MADSRSLIPGLETSLFEAMQLAGSRVVSLIGAGGKSSLLMKLADEISLMGKRVITTTTTHILSQQATGHLVLNTDEHCLIQEAEQAIDRYSHISVALYRETNGKLKGPGPDLVTRLAVLADHTIVEADGAGGKPLKVPGTTEPVIPSNTSTVVAVAGIDSLGRTVEEAVFRPHLARTLLGINPEDRVTCEMVAGLLNHPDGITRGSPGHAILIGFINKVETPAQLSDAVHIAHLLVNQRRFGRVIIGRAQEKLPVIKIVEQE